MGYYTGVRLPNNVSSYADARRTLEHRAKTSKVRAAEVLVPGGISAGLGHPRSDVTRIRMLRDESIACRLYNTDVVVWHPDNRVTVESYPSVTTGDFANALLPQGLWLGGESEMMSFFPTTTWSNWRERWAAARICNGSGTYVEQDGSWVPEQDTLRPMVLLETDRGQARAVSRAYQLAAFKTWLFAACPLIEIEHSITDFACCAEHLLRSEWREAARYLPAVSGAGHFGTQIKPLFYNHQGRPVTLTSVDYLRRWLYHREGATTTSEVATMPLAQYEQQRKARKQLESTGVWLRG